MSSKKKVFDEAVKLYPELSAEFKGKSGQPNLEQCGNILSKLKILITQLTFLPTEENSNCQKVGRRIVHILKMTVGNDAGKRCDRAWRAVLHRNERYPCFPKVHAAAESLLLRLQGLTKLVLPQSAARPQPSLVTPSLLSNSIKSERRIKIF